MYMISLKSDINFSEWNAGISVLLLALIIIGKDLITFPSIVISFILFLVYKKFSTALCVA